MLKAAVHPHFNLLPQMGIEHEHSTGAVGGTLRPYAPTRRGHNNVRLPKVLSRHTSFDVPVLLCATDRLHSVDLERQMDALYRHA